MTLKTEIIVITDRSGSMQSLARDVIGGYNKFLADQQAEPGEAKLTFVQFNDKYEIVSSGVPVREAKPLTSVTYVPAGSTALLDAMGRTLAEQAARIATEKWAELVIVCVITDGEENASREYSKAKVQEMVKHCEENGWKFIFQAANVDAFAVSAMTGSQSTYGQNFAATAQGVAGAYASNSATVRNLRSGIDTGQMAP